MLNWDEEVKPSSQKTPDGGLQSHRPDMAPPASFQSPALQSVAASAPLAAAAPAAAAEPSQHRRVNAAD